MLHVQVLFGLFLCVASVTSLEFSANDDRFNFFDIELLQTLAREGHEDLVVAPASVKAALTALVEGTGGRTAEEIISLLRLSSDTNSLRQAAFRSLAPFKASRVGAELDLTTRLWSANDVNVNPKYNDVLRQYYQSDIQSINFADTAGSANLINNWVRQQTRGNIQSIVDPGSLVGAKLLLTNALYFKSNWKTSFDRTLTAVRCFQVPNVGCQNTHLMESLSTYPYAYIPSLDANVIELPYADEKLSMLIILPEREENGIHGLVRDLTHTPLSLIVGSLQETEVLLSLPRFTIETKLDLKPTLETLGIRDLFNLNANLSGIVNGPVKIGNVLHNAKIQVNEEGTVAAAVTGLTVVPLMGTSVQRFRADRPFIFIIRESDSGAVLFAGRVVKPEFIPDQVVQQTNVKAPVRRLRRSSI